MAPFFPRLEALGDDLPDSSSLQGGHDSDRQSNSSLLVSEATSNGSCGGNEVSSKPRLLIVSRHAERVDFTFGNWIPVCFDSDGNYSRKDLNQPKLLPKRANCQDYFKDSPLTTIGLTQATLTGDALQEAGVSFSHAYASPSFRCVQTCTNILKAMGLSDKLKINIEPALFEWMRWYQGKGNQPQLMTPAQLKQHGYNINLDYKSLMTQQEVLACGTETNETCEQYYERSQLVSNYVLKTVTGNVLFVAHAASIDTCTRQLTGKPPRNEQDLVSFVLDIPYCGISAAEESPATKEWSLVKPPILTLQHTANQRYDWKLLRNDKFSSLKKTPK